MARYVHWCVPIALAISACQTPPLTPAHPPSSPAPAAQEAEQQAEHGDVVYEVRWTANRGSSYFDYDNRPVGNPGDARSYYPDLTGIAPSSFYIDTNSPGKALLRFPTAIGNSGPGLFRIRGKVLGNITQGTQEIVDGRGNVLETKDVGTFEYHPNHGHFHVSAAARYELHRGGHDGEKVQDGKKISFCMEDSIRFKDSRYLTPQIANCTETMQGITPGYADVYSASLPEQVFDMTHMPSGEYTITIQLDPQRKFLELNPNNNYAWVQLRYDAGSKRAVRLADYP